MLRSGERFFATLRMTVAAGGEASMDDGQRMTVIG